MAPLWAELAERLEGRLFTPSLPNLHASYAHAQAHAWNRVALAIEAELDARPHPLLLVRLAEGVCTAIPPRSRASAVDAPMLAASSNGCTDTRACARG
jgi:hypothetical protein